MLSAYECATVALGNSATAGVIPFDLRVTNASRGGFPLPDEDQMEFTVAGPVDVWVVGGDPTGEFCTTWVKGSPGDTVSGYVLVHGFKTPNRPSGDYSVLASHLALFAAGDYNTPRNVLMPLTVCRSNGSINVQQLTDPPRAWVAALARTCVHSPEAAPRVPVSGRAGTTSYGAAACLTGARMKRPVDRWQSVPASWGEVVNTAVARVLNERRQLLAEEVRFIPMLASAHFAACRATALEANRAGFHAVALALARQSMESLTVIEVGMLDRSTANDLLAGWQSEKLTQGAPRKRLADLSWRQMPSTPWGISWLDHMTSLAGVLQPYAHYSPGLLQWNLALVEQPRDGQAIAAIGHGAFDPDKAERLALLLSVFLWNVLVMLSHYGELDADAVSVHAELELELGRTQWLDAGEGWRDQLIPHVWFRE